MENVIIIGAGPEGPCCTVCSQGESESSCDQQRYRCIGESRKDRELLWPGAASLRQ